MASSSQHALNVHIRWMIRRDMPEVLAIERACFDRPWPEDKFLAMLRSRNVIGVVAERGDEILGYMIYEMSRNTIRLHHLAVDPSRHRLWVGTQMMSKLFNKLTPERRNRIVLECRESNLAACKFYRSCGLTATGVVRGHYRDTGEDAYVFEYRLPTEAE